MLNSYTSNVNRHRYTFVYGITKCSCLPKYYYCNLFYYKRHLRMNRCRREITVRKILIKNVTRSLARSLFFFCFCFRRLPVEDVASRQLLLCLKGKGVFFYFFLLLYFFGSFSSGVLKPLIARKRE